MEIHKPNPIHNFREFLKEVGIIVLGVLIALGAEQTVEALPTRSPARRSKHVSTISSIPFRPRWKVDATAARSPLSQTRTRRRRARGMRKPGAPPSRQMQRRTRRLIAW